MDDEISKEEFVAILNGEKAPPDELDAILGPQVEPPTPLTPDEQLEQMVVDLHSDKVEYQDALALAESFASTCGVNAKSVKAVVKRVYRRKRDDSWQRNLAKTPSHKTPLHADCADLIVDELMRTEEIIDTRMWRQRWWRYKKNGWGEAQPSDIQGGIVTWLRRQPDYRRHANRTYTGNVMLNLGSNDLCLLPSHLAPPIWLDTKQSAPNWMRFKNNKIVNVVNWARRLNGEDVSDHDIVRKCTPNLFSMDTVDYDWDPDATASRFAQFLGEVMPNPDDMALLCCMMGLALTDITRHEVFFVLYGCGQNGKSVTLSIIEAMVGRHNVAHVDLGQLSDKFATWPLSEKKLNVCGDLRTDMIRSELAHVEGLFKDWVSGGTVECERKGKDKYDAKCRARFVMATNHLPGFADTSDGIWRRMRIIKYPNQITEEDRDAGLSETIIKSEMPGVLNWALDGLAMILQKSGVPDSPQALDIKRAHRKACDRERLFVEETGYEPSDDVLRISCKDLYDEYAGWARDNGYRAKGKQNFLARLQQIMPTITVKKARVEGTITNAVVGLHKVPHEEDLL